MRTVTNNNSTPSSAMTGAGRIGSKTNPLVEASFMPPASELKIEIRFPARGTRARPRPASEKWADLSPIHHSLRYPRQSALRVGLKIPSAINFYQSDADRIDPRPD